MASRELTLSETAPGLILASASPRRRAILAVLGLTFEAVDLNVDESALPGEAPESLARRLAVAKASQGAQQFPGAVVLGADTVVALRLECLGKPRGPAEATEMLRRLRGRPHRVVTAVAAARAAPGGRSAPTVWGRVAATLVWMRDYTDAEIECYVASGEPFDKAGAYAIQDAGFRPVARVAGCFLTVVGLPLSETCQVLAEAGAPRPRIVAADLDALCPSCPDREVLLTLSS